MMTPESLPSAVAGACLRPLLVPAPALPGDAPLPVAEPGRLHELYAVTPGDAPAAAAAALLLAAARPGRIAWLRPLAAERRGGRLYAPGLAALGLDPARLLLVLLPDDLALLKAAAELLRAGGLAALILEPHGAAARLDLTASRCLALAAAAGAMPCLALRVGGEPVPSAAWRRWLVAGRPSRPLAAKAPGAPVVAMELARNRSGPAGGRHGLEWRAGGWAPTDLPPETDDADRPAAAPALAGAALSLPPRRPAVCAWRGAG
jgi:protein ImuA